MQFANKLQDYFQKLLLLISIFFAFSYLRFLVFPRAFWLDEWFVIHSLKFKEYSQLFGPLDYALEFPRIYMAFIKWFSSLFIFSELSLRLIPWLLGCVSLVLTKYIFEAIFSNRLVGYYGVLITISCSAVIGYFVQVKQYTMDYTLALIPYLLLVKARKHNWDKKTIRLFLFGLPGLFLSYSYGIFFLPLYFASGLIFYFRRILSARNLMFYWFIGFLCLATDYMIDLHFPLNNGQMKIYWAPYFVQYDSIDIFLNSIFLFFSRLATLVALPFETTGYNQTLGKLLMFTFSVTRPIVATMFALGTFISIRKVFKSRFASLDRTLAESSYELYVTSVFLLMFFLYLFKRLPVEGGRLNISFLPAFVFLLLSTLVMFENTLIKKLGVTKIATFVAVFLLFAPHSINSIYKEVIHQSSWFPDHVYLNIGTAISNANDKHVPIVIDEGALPYHHEMTFKTHPNYDPSKSIPIKIAKDRMQGKAVCAENQSQHCVYVYGAACEHKTIEATAKN